MKLFITLMSLFISCVIYCHVVLDTSTHFFLKATEYKIQATEVMRLGFMKQHDSLVAISRSYEAKAIKWKALFPIDF